MIKSFRHRGLEKYFKTGSKAGINPQHAHKLKIQLTALEHAVRPKDLNARVPPASVRDKILPLSIS